MAYTDEQHEQHLQGSLAFREALAAGRPLSLLAPRYFYVKPIRAGAARSANRNAKTINCDKASLMADAL